MAAWTMLFLTGALVVASTNARSLLQTREGRFASVEGFGLDADDHQHHRVARGADEACDDNSDLVGQFVDAPPVMEDCEVVVYKPPQPVAANYELIECPEDRNGAVLSADDATLTGDLEATLCNEGLHPELEAVIEPCAGRPARDVDVDVDLHSQQAEAGAVEAAEER